MREVGSIQKKGQTEAYFRWRGVVLRDTDREEATVLACPASPAAPKILPKAET
jgi:hypothetical protein